MYLRSIGVKDYLEYSMVNINLDSLHELQPPMLNVVVLLPATCYLLLQTSHQYISFFLATVLPNSAPLATHLSSTCATLETS